MTALLRPGVKLGNQRLPFAGKLLPAAAAPASRLCLEPAALARENLVMLEFLIVLASLLPVPDSVTLEEAFQDWEGAFVLTECESGETFQSSPEACAQSAAPCSTFKIWNTAIGLETGLVRDPEAPFWKWDGIERGIKTWNQNQTLQSAFSRSCVPAFQELARKIGPERMQDWLERIDYGDKNISAGIDVFWLPQPPRRRTILISPDEQSALLVRLVKGELPFSASTLKTLKQIMEVKRTERGTLYGKTGSGTNKEGRYLLGWFVGYVESSGRSYAFACLLHGEGAMGPQARDATEKILSKLGLL